MTHEWKDIADWLDWWLREPRLSADGQKVFDRYYKSYKKDYSAYIRRHYQSQTDEIMALIATAKSPRVLEIGCGCGTESLWFALNGASVVGVELAAHRLAVARERLAYLRGTLGLDIDASFEDTSLFDMDRSAEFDIIWLEQAFHHIEPRQQVPGKLFGMLKPGGHVVISEANGWNPFLQALLFRKRGFRTIREYTDQQGKVHMYGVERITTPGAIERLFAGAGFERQSVRYFRTLPNFRGVDRFAGLDDLVPGWLRPAYTHFNIVFRKPG